MSKSYRNSKSKLGDKSAGKTKGDADASAGSNSSKIMEKSPRQQPQSSKDSQPQPDAADNSRNLAETNPSPSNNSARNNNTADSPRGAHHTGGDESSDESMENPTKGEGKQEHERLPVEDDDYESSIRTKMFLCLEDANSNITATRDLLKRHVDEKVEEIQRAHAQDMKAQGTHCPIGTTCLEACG